MTFFQSKKSPAVNKNPFEFKFLPFDKDEVGVGSDGNVVFLDRKKAEVVDFKDFKKKKEINEMLECLGLELV
jgi:hypothetical protein